MSKGTQWSEHLIDIGEFGSTERASDVAFERHFTVSEISRLWHMDKNTVRRLFASEPDIVCFGTEENQHRRRYKGVRVPESPITSASQAATIA
jgi:hypothetical protein